MALAGWQMALGRPLPGGAIERIKFGFLEVENCVLRNYHPWLPSGWADPVIQCQWPVGR